MTNGQVVEFGFLNVVAMPHPNGIYQKLLKAASNIRYDDQANNFTVITESNGTVVTVITGKR